jgi:hypothetical protein
MVSHILDLAIHLPLERDPAVRQQQDIGPAFRIGMKSDAQAALAGPAHPHPQNEISEFTLKDFHLPGLNM